MKILCTKVKKKFQKTLTISKVRPDSEKNAIKGFEPGLRNGSKNKKVFSNVCFSQNWDTLRTVGGHIFVKYFSRFFYVITTPFCTQGPSWPSSKAGQRYVLIVSDSWSEE